MAFDSRATKRSQDSQQGGFTLIELLAVMTIISILAASLMVGIPFFVDKAEASACRENLKTIHKYFIALQDRDRTKGPPREGGVALLALLWQKVVDDQTLANAKRLTCSAVPPGQLDGWIDENDEIMDPTEIWGTDNYKKESNRNLVARIRQSGRMYSSFRAIDNSGEQRVKKWSSLMRGKRPLVADGNPMVDEGEADGEEAELNHRKVTNVLMGDGNVETIYWDEIDELAEEEGAERLNVVGPRAEHSDGKYKNLVFNPARN